MNNFIQNLLGIEDENIIIDDYFTDNTTNTLIIHVSLRRTQQVCQQCGSIHTYVHSHHPKKLIHSNFTSQKCILLYNQKRYECLDCKATFLETNYFALRHNRISDVTLNCILKDLKTTDSYLNIANRYNVTSQTVLNYMDKYIDPKRRCLPEVLCIDEFKNLSHEDCVPTLRRAVNELNSDFGDNKTVSDGILLNVAACCGGDVRMSIGAIENAYYISGSEITSDAINALLPTTVGHFDRDGDVHYDLLSCLQKSIRGSDPDAAIFYLARILASGDLLSACRRLLVIANEDIGCAYPLAPVITYACTESARSLGLPEAAIPLANAVCILATAPKSNSSYMALHKANEDISQGRGTAVPEHLSSPEFNGYQYPHDFVNNYVHQTYLPKDLADRKYYEFGSNKTEQAAKAYYDYIRSQADVKK